VRLIANRRGEMHDGVNAAQRVAEGGRIGEVAESDLHAHALSAQAARVAHQAAHLSAFGDETTQHGGANETCGAGEQQHRPNLAESSPAQMVDSAIIYDGVLPRVRHP